MRDRTVNATEFKAKCLGIMDDIDKHGGRVTVTRRGKPLVVVAKAEQKRRKSLFGLLEGQVIIAGDIVSPLEWECTKSE